MVFISVKASGNHALVVEPTDRQATRPTAPPAQAMVYFGGCGNARAFIGPGLVGEIFSKIILKYFRCYLVISV